MTGPAKLLPERYKFFFLRSSTLSLSTSFSFSQKSQKKFVDLKDEISRKFEFRDFSAFLVSLLCKNQIFIKDKFFLKFFLVVPTFWFLGKSFSEHLFPERSNCTYINCYDQMWFWIHQVRHRGNDFYRYIRWANNIRQHTSASDWLRISWKLASWLIPSLLFYSFYMLHPTFLHTSGLLTPTQSANSLEYSLTWGRTFPVQLHHHTEPPSWDAFCFLFFCHPLAEFVQKKFWNKVVFKIVNDS